MKRKKITSRIADETGESIVFDMGEQFDGTWLRVESRPDGGAFVDHAALDHEMILSRDHALVLAHKLIGWAARTLPKPAKKRSRM